MTITSPNRYCFLPLCVYAVIALLIFCTLRYLGIAQNLHQWCSDSPRDISSMRIHSRYKSITFGWLFGAWPIKGKWSLFECLKHSSDCNFGCDVLNWDNLILQFQIKSSESVSNEPSYFASHDEKRYASLSMKVALSMYICFLTEKTSNTHWCKDPIVYRMICPSSSSLFSVVLWLLKWKPFSQVL